MEFTNIQSKDGKEFKISYNVVFLVSTKRLTLLASLLERWARKYVGVIRMDMFPFAIVGFSEKIQWEKKFRVEIVSRYCIAEDDIKELFTSLTNKGIRAW